MAQSRIAQLLFKLGADNKALLSKMKQTETRMQKFQKNVSRVGVALGGVFAVSKLVEFGKHASDLAGKMEGVEVAFNKLNDPRLLDNLKKATNDTASELVLMQQAVKANNFRIPMDVFAKGLEFATKRANETGESIDYMINSFTTGLGRESIKILDNLGISALELSEEVEKVGDFTTAVGNIMDRELVKMGDHMDTDAQKTQQVAAAMDNLAIVIGQTLNPAVGILKTGLADAAIAATGFLDAFNKITDSKSLTFWEKLIGVIAPHNSMMREAMAIASEYIETEDEKMDRLHNEAVAMAEKIKNDEAAATAARKLAAANKQLARVYEESVTGKGFKLFDEAAINMQMADVSGSLQRNFDKWKELIAMNMVDIGGMISQGIGDAITNISEGLGLLAAGEIGYEQFFRKVLDGFATFLKQMGAMLIAYGVANVAMQSGNPYVMIAAGAAMIAIGAAMGALMKRNADVIGGGGSGGGVGNSYASTGYTSPQLNLTGVIRGEDIHIVTQKYQSRTERTGG